MGNCSGWTKKNILLLLTAASVFVGVAVGFGLKLVPKLGPAVIETIGLLGELFIRMLQMTVLPLVTCSVMIGLATLDPRTSKRVVMLSFAYYALTTTIAVVTGVALALAIAPGKRTDWHDPNTREGVSNIAPPLSTQDALFDLFRNIFPENMAQACVEQYRTVYQYATIYGNSTMPRRLSRLPEYTSRINIIGMITISTVCGIFLGRMREKGGMLVRILFVVDHVTMKLISLIMWYSPVGIACLIAARLLEVVVDLWRALSALGCYIATVISGFLIQMFFVQPLIYMLLTRKNPLTFMKGLLQVWVTAFVTSSSAATLAMNVECCEENLNIGRRITHFVLPFGTTVNMNGTAIYEAVSAIFIAQLIKGYNLTVTRIVVISVTAIITSVGAAPVPSAVVVPLTVVLGSVGLDTTHVATILALDWILDRICTSVNVVSDGFCAGIVDHYCKNSLTMANSIAQLSLADASAGENGATKISSQASEYKDSGPSMVKTIDRNGDTKDNVVESPLRQRHRAFARNHLCSLNSNIALCGVISDGNNGIFDTRY